MARWSEKLGRPRWDVLVREMELDGIAVPMSVAKLRSVNFARRSVIIPSLGTPGFTGINGHVARLKTKDPHWQQITLAWLRSGIRQCVVMESLLGALLEEADKNISFYAYANRGWLGAALINRGFKAISPSYLPHMFPRDNEGACYVHSRVA